MVKLLIVYSKSFNENDILHTNNPTQGYELEFQWMTCMISFIMVAQIEKRTQTDFLKKTTAAVKCTNSFVLLILSVLKWQRGAYPSGGLYFNSPRFSPKHSRALKRKMKSNYNIINCHTSLLLRKNWQLVQQRHHHHYQRRL